MGKEQEIKRLLRAVYNAPEPQRKRRFLKGLKRRRVSNTQFLLQQAAYIRKRTWGLALMVFLGGLAGGYYMEDDVLWLLSAMMPFLALSSVTEFSRSETHGMAELEMAARFGLKTTMLARMAVLGILHMATLCLAALAGSRGGISVFRTGIYLLVPYLLTDTAALWITRKIRGREGVYASAGAAALVGILPLLARYVAWWILQNSMFQRWLLGAVLLVLAAGSEWKKCIKKTEELTWS